MEEINHFFHEEHPLKLIEWEKQGVVIECDICEESVSVGDSAYACTECRFFLHKSSSQLPKIVNFPSFYHEPLNIRISKTVGFTYIYACRICCRRISKGFFYRNTVDDHEPGFNACASCSLVHFACKAEYDAIKEKAAIKLQHEGHPGHSLTLQLRHGAFRCDACRTDEKGLFYLCDSCDFWIHETCAFLPPTISLPHHHPKHPLVLVYSISEKFYKYPYYCKFCTEYIQRNVWLYHCGNCRYFAHIKCALNAQNSASTSSEASDDAHSLLHFPMPEAFTDPLKLLHSNILAQDDKEEPEIDHWSHPAHPLILNVEDPQGNNMMPGIISGDPIKVCYACVRPLSFPHYRCKNGCSFPNLHKYCAQLPQKLQHHLHADHTLELESNKIYRCNGCSSYGNTFSYKGETKCKFYFCVNCAFLPKTIKHESHNHPLNQLIDRNVPCNTCYKWSAGVSYACKDCDFQLDLYCAMRSPISLAHRYCKGHEIPLTYPPVENHPEDFYCDICEEEMNPNLPLYHCQNCKYRNSFHPGCISRIDIYANIWFEGRQNFSIS